MILSKFLSIYVSATKILAMPRHNLVLAEPDLGPGGDMTKYRTGLAISKMRPAGRRRHGRPASNSF